MTLSQIPPESVAADVPGPEPLRFPLEYIVSKGSPPIQYRAMKLVGALGDASDRLPALIYSYFPALRLAISQRLDGTWNGKMLAVPPEGTGEPFGSIGTIPAVHRLLELGFEADFPPLATVRRALFRLLAEDNDPAYLYELAEGGSGVEYRRYGRRRLREAAAAALAHLGYENDPRLRGCANRMVNRVREFLQSPLAHDPWMRIGNKHVLSPEASPPSIALLVMLGHMPHYRHEHFEFLEELREFLIRPVGQKEVQQQVGGAVVPQPQLLLGDPCTGRGAPSGDLGATLFWMETLARIGYLDTHGAWSQVFDRLVQGCDQNGVWRPPRSGLPAPSALPEAWPSYPLDPRREADAVSAEVTTRLAIIARAAGRAIELS